MVLGGLLGGLHLHGIFHPAIYPSQCGWGGARVRLYCMENGWVGVVFVRIVCPSGVLGGRVVCDEFTQLGVTLHETLTREF